jgi:transcriptional regulator with PAS, ATPase and Fis domain
VEPPITRLKTAGRQAFVVNPVDCLVLSTRMPGITAYMLEDVTEMQRQLERLEQENRAILSAAGFAAGQFLGTSPKILAIKEIASRAARSDATVLIQGETGTGKEVLAHFIHQQSSRKNGPFVRVDCSTIPRELMESELFGHEKGAFTGATERQVGLLEKAEGGTLFLDEVSNLSLAVQAKLLHFMQEHAIMRVGGRDPVPLNIRIVVASNIPLRTLVDKNEFRSDLYYRIEVITIFLPPLRERREDIPELCRHFISRFNEQHGRRIKDLSPAAYEKIFAYPWPGNIRELKNTLERAVIFCDENQITPVNILLGAEKSAPAGPGVRQKSRPLKKMDTDAIMKLFTKHDGVAQKVARDLKVSGRALYYKIKMLGLTPEQMRKS